MIRMQRYTFTTVSAHTAPVTALDVAGTCLLSTSMDGTPRVYGLAGTELPRLRHVLPHHEGVRCGGTVRHTCCDRRERWLARDVGPHSGACLETIGGFSQWRVCLSREDGALYFAAGDDIVALDLVTNARRVFPPDGRDQLMTFALAGPRRLVGTYAEVSNSPSPPFRYNLAFHTTTGARIANRHHAADSMAD